MYYNKVIMHIHDINDNDNEVYSYPGLQACEIYTCTNIKLKYTATSIYILKDVN